MKETNTDTNGTDRFRYWVSVPFMLLSTVLLANAQIAARAGNYVSGGQWLVAAKTDRQGVDS